MQRKIMPLGSIDANCIILWEDPAAAWIVDPGAEPEAICAFLKAKGLTPALILFTHGHFDHIGAVDGILARYPNLPVHVGPGDVPMIGHPMNAWPPDYEVVKKPATLVADLIEGATLTAGGLTAQVLATPGHTPGGVCILFAAQKLLLTGDTLFAGSCGRTDFPGGDKHQLDASLSRLAALDPELTVVPGHGIPTTIAHEVATNPFMQ